MDRIQNKKPPSANSPGEGMLRQMVESVGDGILILGETGNILYANSSATNLFGKESGDELIGENFGFPVSRQEKTEIDLLYGGNEIVVEMSFMDFVWNDSAAILVTLHDITHHRELERRLKLARDAAESADRTKSEFLANMSHEMRTPLSGILGMSNLIAMTDTTEEQREYLEMLNESARNLQHIINDLLDLSRIEAGHMELKESPFSVQRILETLLTPLNLTANRKNIRLRYNIDSEVPDRLIGDAGRLKQILNNLLSNALKFTEHGTITIDISREPVSTTAGKIKLRFVVSDTGTGIPEENITSIFERFHQVDGSSSRKHQGTGLGLSIAQHLTHMLGGDIWVESKPGAGSKFFFTILASIDSERNTRRENYPEKKRKQRPSIAGYRVLLADDNSTFRKYLTVALSRSGLHIQTAENGLEAWDLIQREKFDLLLLDYSMPGMDGKRVMNKVRDSVDGTTVNSVPIIAITAHALKGDRDRFIQMGMDDYISKPVDLDRLMDLIETHLSRKETDRI